MKRKARVKGADKAKKELTSRPPFVVLLFDEECLRSAIESNKDDLTQLALLSQIAADGLYGIKSESGNKAALTELLIGVLHNWNLGNELWVQNELERNEEGEVANEPMDVD